MKLLLFTVTLLLTLKSISQNKIDIDKIDSLAKVLDLRIEQRKGIGRAYMGRFDDGNGRTKDCLIIDTLNKELLKVISVQIIEIKFKDEKENKEWKLKGMPFPKDTIRTAYYFYNNSLVKLKRKSAFIDFEIYFNNNHCLQRTAQSKTLVNVDWKVCSENLSDAGNYLRNFKSLIPYVLSNVRAGEDLYEL